MAKRQDLNAWKEVVEFPLAGREKKPRKQGLTMVIDKGLGLTDTRELLEMAADYIDSIKLTFGTSAFYHQDILKKKIELVKSFHVEIFPVVTFLDVAISQGRLAEFLDRALELGFTCIEVSDGTITLPAAVRAETIRQARAAGFKVFSEVGKKDPRDRVSKMKIREQIASDLAEGAEKVIIEGQESGRGVLIYDQHGAIMPEELEAVIKMVENTDCLLWEAPLKDQQHALVAKFGSNVCLGNIKPEDIFALEALRVGLRGDTFRRSLLPRCQQELETRQLPQRLGPYVWEGWGI